MSIITHIAQVGRTDHAPSTTSYMRYMLFVQCMLFELYPPGMFTGPPSGITCLFSWWAFIVRYTERTTYRYNLAMNMSLACRVTVTPHPCRVIYSSFYTHLILAYLSTNCLCLSFRFENLKKSGSECMELHKYRSHTSTAPHQTPYHRRVPQTLGMPSGSCEHVILFLCHGLRTWSREASKTKMSQTYVTVISCVTNLQSRDPLIL